MTIQEEHDPYARHAEASRRTLARHAEGTRPVFVEENPPLRRLCPVCKGTGLETHEGPHAGSCSGCRGFRRVVMSEADMRIEYRTRRREARERYAIAPRTFDAMIAAGLSEDAGPSDWVRAARLVIGKLKGKEKGT